MSNIENRIVTMTFDNDRFEQNIAATMASLDRLSDSLRLVGTDNGLNQIADSASNFDVSNMEGAIQGISDKLSIMGAIGFTVIQDLTRAATDFVTGVGSKFLDPLLSGGMSRALNLEQAEFLFGGIGIDIAAGMASALKAVKGTAFGLDIAAKTAAQLGASGIETGEEMTGALRGIAGVAAITNTSFEEMAQVFVSAAGSGKVMNNELARISYRGVNIAAAIGKELNLTENQVKILASEGKLSFDVFAKAVDDAFGEHATKANETYTGSLSNLNAAISRIGASFYGVRLEQQRDLFNAMTPVVDDLADAFQPLIDVILEITGAGTKNLVAFLNALDITPIAYAIAIVSNGIRNLFKLVTDVGNMFKQAFREVFPKSEESKLISIALLFEKFTEIIQLTMVSGDQLRSAFKGVFSVFAIGIEIVKEVAKGFGTLLGAVFSNIDGGGTLDFFSNLGLSLENLKKQLVDGGGIARFFEKIRDTLVEANQFLLEHGISIKNFFGGLSDLITDPIGALEQLKQKLVSIFSGKEGVPGSGVANAAIERLTERFEMFGAAIRGMRDAWDWLDESLGGATDLFDKLFDYIRTWFAELGQKLKDVLTPADFNAAVDVLNVGLIGGIIYALKKFVQDGKVVLDLTGGFMDGIKYAVEELTGVLQNMQLELKAKALLKIAGAIAVLSVSLLLLSMIDSAALTKALVAMGVGFTMLVSVMKAMEGLDVGLTSTKLVAIGTAMILLAVSATVLAVAITALSKLGWEELAKGLIGVGVGLQILVRSISAITADTSGLIRAGIAMIGISLALIVLAKAVEAFGALSWTELAKGLIGVGVGLGVLTKATNAFPKGMVAIGAGLVLLAAGLYLLSYSIEAMAAISWGDMGKGLLGIAASLLVINVAMDSMPMNMPITATGILILSAALLVMAKAVEAMGVLDGETLAKGIGSIAAMLALLAAAMYAMSGSLPGAAALVVVSGALAILSKVLTDIAKLSFQELIIGLTGIGLTLIILGTAAAAMQPVLPALYALGIALGIVGAAFALFGGGVALLAKGLETFARSGKAGINAMLGSFELIIAAVPRLTVAFVQSLIGMATTFLDALPLIVKSVTVLIKHILEAVQELAPEIADTFIEIVKGIFKSLRELGPDFIETGFILLTSLMQGIRDHISEIITLGTDIITNLATALSDNSQAIVDAAVDILLSFLEAIANRALDIAQAGSDLIVSFVQGITQNITKVVSAVGDLVIRFIAALALKGIEIAQAGGALLRALLGGIAAEIIKVATTVTTIVTTFIEEMGGNATEIAQAGTDALTSFLGGITENIQDVINAVGTVVTTIIEEVGDAANSIATAGADFLVDFLDGIQDNIRKVGFKAVTVVNAFINEIGDRSVQLARGAADALTDFLNGLADAIRDKAPQIRRAGSNIASAIIEGATGGLSAKAGDFYESVSGVFSKGVEFAKAPWSILSPSKVSAGIGENIILGLVKGIDGNADKAHSSIGGMSTKLKDAFERTLGDISDDLLRMDEFNPTITPVLDLARVEEGAKGLSGLLGNGADVGGGLSLKQARDISLAQSRALTEDDGLSTTPQSPSEIKFEQNIYAPRELSTKDIYNQTKSQITLAKSELGVS